MIGDVLTSSILCEVLKERFRESEIHYLINSHTTAVLENNPFIDQQIVFSPEMEESVSLRKGLKNLLKKQQYDVVIDVYSKLGSAEITRATGAKLRIGYRKWYTKWAYTHTFTYDRKPKTIAGLAIENRMRLLTPIASDFPEYLKPKIYLTAAEKAAAKRTLEQNGLSDAKPLLMISLLGSGPDKTYPLVYMAKLLDHIATTTASKFLLNYIPKQQPQVDELLTLVSEPTRAQIFDKVYGRSLRDFLALTSHCSAIIGNEGGAINMAKALDIPSFAIFSPWITREAWGLFEGLHNASFHLKDIKPDIYQYKKLKEIKKNYGLYYDQMHPDNITTVLDGFITKNVKKKD